MRVEYVCETCGKRFATSAEVDECEKAHIAAEEKKAKLQEARAERKKSIEEKIELIQLAVAELIEETKQYEKDYKVRVKFPFIFDWLWGM